MRRASSIKALSPRFGNDFRLERAYTGAMKRLHGREMALLCSPLLIIALVGWLVSKRKTPSPVQPLHLAFHVEKPTTLEAFKGSDAALVVRLAGEGADKMQVTSSDPWLEVQGAHGAERSYMLRGYSGIWTKVRKSNSNGTRFTINSQVIPAGQLRFGTSSAIQTLSATTFAAPRRGSWLLNRAQMQAVWIQEDDTPSSGSFEVGKNCPN